MKNLTAKLRYLRIAPRKTRALADTLKGLSINNAQAQLVISPRRAAKSLLKLLNSAAANAKHNAKMDLNNLFVREIRVDQGPKSKRFTPRARGSASPIEKKTSHVTLVLGVSKEPKESRYTFQEKTKKTKDKKQPKKPEQFKEEKKAEPKPVKTPNFFQKVFRRKSI